MSRTCSVFVAGIVLAAGIALAPAPVRAMHAADGPEIRMLSDELPVGLSVRGSLGTLNGNAHRSEYVADPSGERRKIAETTWDMRGIYLLGIEATVEAMDQFRVNLGFWKAVNEGSGMMQEQRWLWIGHDWSHWQQGSVDVASASMFDLNAALDVFNYEGIMLSGLVGWRRDAWTWLDRAMWYTETDKAFRDVHGTLDGQNTMGYRQVFSTPYAGAGARGTFGPADVELYLAFSPLSKATDSIHYKNRELKTFRDGIHTDDRSGLGVYVGLGGRGVYNITDNVFAGLALDMQSYPGRSAERKVLETNEVIADGAALSQSAVMLSALVGWRL